MAADSNVLRASVLFTICFLSVLVVQVSSNLGPIYHCDGSHTDSWLLPVQVLAAEHETNEVLRRTKRQVSAVGPVNRASATDNEELNRLAQEAPINNSTNNTVLEVDHDYYVVSYLNEDGFEDNWVDLDAENATEISYVLSSSHKLAATVELKFDFPFYGHMIRNITIATGGFIYTGNFIHQWMTSTQYIAPLMGNFNPSLHNDSVIRYFDTEDGSFIVEWKNVLLHDQQTVGNYTFQVILLENGDITFNYEQVPIPISNLSTVLHPVKLGVSDAYMFISEHFNHYRQRTFYHYHTVKLNFTYVATRKSIYLKHQPTCIMYSEGCEECLESEANRDADVFNCRWCPKLQRCSSGVDRRRQEWIMADCQTTSITDPDACAEFGNVTQEVSSVAPTAAEAGTPQATTQPGGVVTTKTSNSGGQSGHHSSGPSIMSKSAGIGIGPAGIAAIIAVFLLVVVLAGWIYYAYSHPTSLSGQLLIKYRPSNWRSRGGRENTRYQVALHM
ncbi:PREDICTED: plexin domain-containing protein 2-like [Priapulus caudatus]|uniref:Plexin domain-containing protein 2-like n=1 Tax=Priapulus caudatus TaxID=37621 RepID=A0ABM1ESG2_PRICU|nr:PREDICTED: plexin domain-containing protein 2-like [Priapulus caudatus]